ncbi:hypothetical protein RB195_009939 [Necator americanus]|uniref:Uncharacterized protein n=1 Tax=Necator americanus TaxID=51031 RepID=A0ABR1CVL9_NECAM
MGNLTWCLECIMYNTRQAEAMIDEQFLDIFLWCNHEVEGNLWRCNARVTIISLGVNGASDAIRKQVTTFHTSNRFMTSTILRNELSMGDILIRLELYDIFGYRDFVMFTIDFTKPSPLTDLNVGFQNSDVRVYVNTQYLSIHSAKFAHLFVRIKPGCAERLCPATENKSEFGTCSDYDVLSLLGLPAEIGEASVQQGYELDRNRCFYQQTSSATAYATAQGDNAAESSPATGLEGNVLILKASPHESEVVQISGGVFVYGIVDYGQHMLWKGERYLMTEEAQLSFNVFQSLEFATLFNMAALQSDCLSKLLTDNDVRQMLDGPSIECAHKQVRSVLLEALLRRTNGFMLLNKVVVS